MVVCTIEKANLLLNRMLEEDALHKLSCVVVDELHMVRPHSPLFQARTCGHAGMSEEACAARWGAVGMGRNPQALTGAWLMQQQVCPACETLQASGSTWQPAGAQVDDVDRGYQLELILTKLRRWTVPVQPGQPSNAATTQARTMDPSQCSSDLLSPVLQ